MMTILAPMVTLLIAAGGGRGVGDAGGGNDEEGGDGDSPVMSSPDLPYPSAWSSCHLPDT